MNSTTAIKKTYLLSTLILTILFLVILTGVIALNYLWQYQTTIRQIEHKALVENKSHLRKEVGDFLASIESDLAYCSGQFRDHEGIPAKPACEATVVIEMAKKRIASRRQLQEVSSEKFNLLELPRAPLPADGGPTFYSATQGPGEEQDIHAVLEASRIAEIVEHGDLFFERGKISAAIPSGAETLVYAKFFPLLNWIVTADIKSNDIYHGISSQKDELRSLLYYQLLKTSVPVFLFLLLAFSITYVLFVRIASGADAQEKRILENEVRIADLEVKVTQSEEALSASDEGGGFARQLLAAVDNAVIVVLVEHNGKLIVRMVSAGVENILGYAESDLKGASADVFCGVNKITDLIKLFHEVHRSGIAISGDLELFKKNGAIMQAKSSVYPYTDNRTADNGVILVAIDISKLEETRRILDDTQESLIEAQKMEAIGTLAGGIAHDFNNVLTSIVGYSELLKDQLPHGSIARRDLAQILNATQRASELVKQIVAFSRKKDCTTSFFEPALIIKETLKMLRSTLPATIEIKSSIAVDGVTIFANPARFHQLFMNLCTNAFKAMEHCGGILEVDLQSIVNPGHVPADFTVDKGRFIHLTVADSGVGIGPQFRNRVFEPLFSTSGSSGRAGMGLCNAYHMVKMAGGAIWFNDRKGGGTDFHVLLPIEVEQHITHAKAEDEKICSDTSGTIMFVDDEPEIVEVARKMLESLGFSVVCCANGEEALQIFKENKGDIHLVITDQTMPGMTGAELASHIRQLGQMIPIILCTGYSARITEKNWKEYGINAFVMKPFRKRDIAIIINELLTEHQKDQVKVPSKVY